ncbi:Rv3235 family protein [Pseudonocardia xishanensis]|uniref:Uncharacterized protein n=1 Tax=Pseudonocardia xishanensis TaxID=630995 RepID=A0ABP8RW00_9PSEU
MTLTAPPVVEPRFVWVRYEPDPEPADEPDVDVPAPRGPQRPTAPQPSHPTAVRAPRTRAHRPDRLTPLVPGSVRAGAREAAARRRAEIVVRIALEVVDGRRPVEHLVPYAAPGVLRYVVAGVPGRSRDEGAPALRSLHCRLVGRAAAEVTALCRFGPRYRALAARLDLTPTGDWRCTALRVL